jgi:hypothetical protein
MNYSTKKEKTSTTTVSFVSRKAYTASSKPVESGTNPCQKG